MSISARRDDLSGTNHTPLLLDVGKCSELARRPDPSRWESYAALGLNGRTREAVVGLQQFDHEQARFHEAVSEWIGGRDDAAMRLLEPLPGEHAARLLQLIRKPRIDVLAQLSWKRNGPSDMMSHVKRDPKFRVRNISTHAHDLPVRPYADIHRYYDPDAAPDFFLSSMVEWHLTPPNIQELPCPLIGQTSDFDVHIQALRPWLPLFDELVTCSVDESASVGDLVRVPVSNYPKSFGVPDEVPPIEHGPREIDFFASGTLLDPYHPDKAETLWHVVRQPDLRLRLVNGFLPHDIYFSMLAATKVCFGFVRFPTGMPTRALEALAMGCAVLIQRGCVLGQFMNEQHGVLEYDGGEELATKVREIVYNWPVWQERARRGAEWVREEFALPRVASQFLRFMTVLAARPRASRRKVDSRQLTQKRVVLRFGWLPGSKQVIAALRSDNIERSEKASEGREQRMNDALRALVLELASDEQPTCRTRRLRHQVSAVFRSAMKQYPVNLALHFNAARWFWHHGDILEQQEGLGLFKFIVSKSQSDWRIDAMDDVMPWDFHPEWFNYRDYFELCTKLSRLNADEQPEKLIAMITASAHHYLAKHGDDDPFDHLSAAVKDDPNFAYYSLNLAEALVGRGHPEDMASAAAILGPLSRGSIIFVEATELLERVVVAVPEAIPSEQVQRAACAATNMTKYCLDANQEHQPQGPDRQVLSHAADEPWIVSVLIDGTDEKHDLASLLANLVSQTILARLEIVIAQGTRAGRARDVISWYQKRFDNIVVLSTSENHGSSLVLNQCIEHARGRYLTVAKPGDGYAEDAMENMATSLRANPDAALVYGDYVITSEANQGLADVPITAYGLPPTFDRRLLFATPYIGRFAMWRRVLHEANGYFDPSYGTAADYEFWLRMARREKFLHIPNLLGLHYDPQQERNSHDLRLKADELQRARQQHWSASWGEAPESCVVDHACKIDMARPILWADGRPVEKTGIMPNFSGKTWNTMMRILRTAYRQKDDPVVIGFLNWLYKTTDLHLLIRPPGPASKASKKLASARARARL